MEITYIHTDRIATDKWPQKIPIQRVKLLLKGRRFKKDLQMNWIYTNQGHKAIQKSVRNIQHVG